MNINATLFGQLMLVWVLLSTVIIGLLAKRKTDSPILTTVVGFVLSFLPLLSMVFMAVLALKKDVGSSQE